MTRLLPVILSIGVVGCQQPPEPDTTAADAALPATEASRDFGDYVVHFNAITTDQLTADVARQ